MKPLHFVVGAAILGSGCSTLSPSEDPTALRVQDLEARVIRMERVLEPPHPRLAKLLPDLSTVQYLFTAR